MSEKVVTHRDRTSGEERVVIETYLPSMEAGRLALSQRVQRVTSVTDDGSKTVEETAEANPVAPAEPMRIVQRSLTTVRRSGSDSYVTELQWPGNVRELRNVLERAAILCEGAPIDTDHLTLPSGAKALRNDTTDLSALERTTIVKVLHDCRGNKTKAARRLGLSRTQLHLRVRKYRLEEAATA